MFTVEEMQFLIVGEAENKECMKTPIFKTILKQFDLVPTLTEKLQDDEKSVKKKKVTSSK